MAFDLNPTGARLKTAAIIFVALVAISYGLGATPFGITFFQPEVNVDDTISLRANFEGLDLDPGPHSFYGGREVWFEPGSFLEEDLKVDIVAIQDLWELPHVIFTFYCGDTVPTKVYARWIEDIGSTTATVATLKPAGSTYTKDDFTSSTQILPQGECTLVRGKYTDESATPPILSVPFEVGSSNNTAVQNAYNFDFLPVGAGTSINTYIVAYMPATLGTPDYDAWNDEATEWIPIVEIDPDTGETNPPPSDYEKVIDDLTAWIASFTGLPLSAVLLALLGSVSYLAAGFIKI